jgi:hypothetical protein
MRTAIRSMDEPPVTGRPEIRAFRTSGREARPEVWELRPEIQALRTLGRKARPEVRTLRPEIRDLRTLGRKARPEVGELPAHGPAVRLKV